MESNKEACLAAVTCEAVRAEPGEPPDLFHIWDCCSLVNIHPGLNLFLLDTAAVAGVMPTLRWLNLSLSLPEDTFISVALEKLKLKVIPVRVVLLEMEFYRKRWMKMQPGWIEHHTKRVNRLLRIRKLAIKMLNKELEHASA